MELTIVVHQEPAGFWSEVVELPGCFASGRTLSELAEAVTDALELYLDEAPLRVQGELRPGAVRVTIGPPDADPGP